VHRGLPEGVPRRCADGTYRPEPVPRPAAARRPGGAGRVRQRVRLGDAVAAAPVRPDSARDHRWTVVAAAPTNAHPPRRGDGNCARRDTAHDGGCRMTIFAPLRTAAGRRWLIGTICLVAAIAVILVLAAHSAAQSAAATVSDGDEAGTITLYDQAG